ncbi:MAG: hypothetical protein QY318_01900 [Candidatus Dojkabacteria bacterium]|nr:MAG: hypothetical protein QY318_01900 [Candidatus Dojkabacteria bacterium]
MSVINAETPKAQHFVEVSSNTGMGKVYHADPDNKVILQEAPGVLTMDWRFGGRMEESADYIVVKPSDSAAEVRVSMIYRLPTREGVSITLYAHIRGNEWTPVQQAKITGDAVDIIETDEREWLGCSTALPMWHDYSRTVTHRIGGLVYPLMIEVKVDGSSDSKGGNVTQVTLHQITKITD